MKPQDEFPKYMFAAGGEHRVFNSAEEIPASGWYDTPQAAEAGQKGSGKAPTPTPTPTPTPAAGNGTELDAHGHPWDPALHAGTKAKTQAGLWRMKVGVTRPAAKEGYPLDL